MRRGNNKWQRPVRRRVRERHAKFREQWALLKECAELERTP